MQNLRRDSQKATGLKNKNRRTGLDLKSEIVSQSHRDECEIGVKEKYWVEKICKIEI